jgi:hypothetical protein
LSVRERATDLDKKNLKKPIDKIKNLWYNNYRKKGKVNYQKISKKILKKVLTKPKKYAIIVIQGKGKTSRPKEKNLKKVKKSLDKPNRMCYNKNVKRNTSYR